MARKQENWKAFKLFFFMIVWSFFMASVFVSAERKLKNEIRNIISYNISDFIAVFPDSVLQATKSVYQDLKLSWQLIAGSILGFIGAAFGSVGGAGGGGVYVPMLTLIVGFDLKSAIAISNCMITGAAITTASYNLKLGKIDYDLVLVIQPMLLLGISIGVNLNLIFADWMIALLLMIIFLVTSTKAFQKGIETWIKESLLNKETVNKLEHNASGIINNEAKYEARNHLEEHEVGVVENVCRKEFGVVLFVWIAFLALQFPKRYLTNCSATYWAVNLLEIAVSFIFSGFASSSFYKRRGGVNLKTGQLISCFFYGVLAGVVGGLLGLGGGFVVAPLFLDLGIPSEVSRATSSFAMIFSSSLSMLEYYLLKRVPVSYALYFCGIASIGGLIGQHIVRKLVVATRRTSFIIFLLAFTILISSLSLARRTSFIIILLAFTILISSLSLGGVATYNIIEKIQRNEYMGFQNFCKCQVQEIFYGLK